MSGKSSILGAHKDRVKTDVRLAPKLIKQIEFVCEQLGVPKNVFFTLAACELVVKISPLLTRKKSEILYKEIASLLQKIQDNLRNL